MFSGAEQLADSFFAELAAQLRLKGGRFHRIAERLDSYGELLTPLGIVPLPRGVDGPAARGDWGAEAVPGQPEARVRRTAAAVGAGAHRPRAAHRRRLRRHRPPHRAPAAEVDPFDAAVEARPAGPPRGLASTIHDVAVDGTFPGAGDGDRVVVWAEAVRAAWSGRAGSGGRSAGGGR
jgi:hypothetical protein